jgi:hypothetical protein
MDTKTQPQQGEQTEMRFDTGDIVKNLVKFHEDMKDLHYSLLKPIGLGEAHQRAWEAIDGVRDQGIDIWKRRTQEQQQNT